jgi:hypothetical protein
MKQAAGEGGTLFGMGATPHLAVFQNIVLQNHQFMQCLSFFVQHCKVVTLRFVFVVVIENQVKQRIV